MGDRSPTPAPQILGRAATEKVRIALPSGWSAELVPDSGPSEKGPRPELRLLYRGEPRAKFNVEFRTDVSKRDALALVTVSDVLHTKPVLFARYLSPPVCQILESRGMSYADVTGNIYLVSDEPLIAISKRGAPSNPWRGPGRPTTSLKGLPAARIARALVDFIPPYSVPGLAELAGSSIGATYRLVDYLEDEALLEREKRGPIYVVKWPELLRKWAEDSSLFEESIAHSYLEPRGVSSLVQRLTEEVSPGSYAATGSIAAQLYAPYAQSRLAMIYSENPKALASDLGLTPTDGPTNVVMVAPKSDVVFERTNSWEGLTVVAPSQAVADLLNGPGRNPAEGERLLQWMEENPDEWRRKSNR